MKNLKILTYPIAGNSKFSNRNLYIFKTHDVALLSWLEEKIRLDMKDGFFLLTIDNHIDLPDISDWEDLIRGLAHFKRINNPNALYGKFKSEFQSLFEGHDVNFILTAFEIGLIDGCLIISPEKNKDNRISKLKKRYPEQGIYFKSYFANLFLPKSYAILDDKCDPEKIEIRRRIKSSNLILDLDLDYFTYNRDENRFVISENNFKWLFNNEEIKTLFLNDAACITIALEESYCNSESQDNCRKIFDRLMQFFQEIDIIQDTVSFNEIEKRLEL